MSRARGNIPSYIDPAWWDGHKDLIRDAKTPGQWVNAIAKAYLIGRMPESLTAEELAEQEDTMDRVMGRKFFHTAPLPGWSL